MSDYYVAEEKAMAPGIAGDWPMVIPKPDNPHGRLVKVIHMDIDEEIRNAGKQRERIAELESAIRTTIEENLHLADGDVCTLRLLKDAISYR